MAIAAAPLSARSAGLPTALAGRFRGGAWRRWAAVVLAFNIALGMGFSVVALRHQADARSRADVLLSDLDAAASAQEALLWQTVAAGTAGDRTALHDAAQRVTAAAAQVAGTGNVQADAQAIAAAVAAEQDAAARVTDLLESDGPVPAAATGSLTSAALGLHSAVTDTARRHRAASGNAGLVADTETLFMMVFAAVMAGLLFRRFEAARRSGELGVAAAKAQGEARFQALVLHSSDLITLVDADLAITYQTPSITRILGYGEDELIGRQLAELTHPEDRLSLLAARAEVVAGAGDSTTSQLRLRHKDGSYRHVQSIHTNLLDDPDVQAVVVTTRDVTARKHARGAAAHQAFHDPLTGLANRALFPTGSSTRWPRAAAHRPRSPCSSSTSTTSRPSTTASGTRPATSCSWRWPSGCIAARPARRHRRPARRRRVRRPARGRCATTGPRPTASPSGSLEPLAPSRSLLDGGEVVGHRQHRHRRAPSRHDAAELLRNADVAMYAAKAPGKGRYRACSTPSMHAAVDRPARAEGRAARGRIDAGRVRVHYQPIVELSTGRLPASRRWCAGSTPSAGWSPPAEFIPLAEETGLIVPIGRWVLREACRQLPAWHGATRPAADLTVSVNLSARQLDEPAWSTSCRARWPRPAWTPPAWSSRSPRACCIDDTTATVGILADLRAPRRPARHRRLRHRVLVAQPTWSSFPVDILKIDKSFVDRIGETPAEIPGVEDPHHSVMVAAISQLGHALHLELVAEGIEQREQVSTLQGLDCQYGQGYYFARPLTSGALAELLHQQAEEPGWNLGPASDRAHLAGSAAG